jgi:hypothetical protein
MVRPERFERPTYWFVAIFFTCLFNNIGCFLMSPSSSIYQGSALYTDLACPHSCPHDSFGGAIGRPLVRPREGVRRSGSFV